jgi:hypothetical protein
MAAKALTAAARLARKARPAAAGMATVARICAIAARPRFALFFSALALVLALALWRIRPCLFSSECEMYAGLAAAHDRARARQGWGQ